VAQRLLLQVAMKTTSFVALFLMVACSSNPNAVTSGAAGGGGSGGEGLPDESYGTTYYVRPDGGNATQCTGLADAAYPGSGEGQACAWIHPFMALPPGGTPRIAGGDRLIIADGDYRMGLGAPGAESCEPTGPWGCLAPAIPSGPDAQHPTRIVGAAYRDGCATRPELWGTERAEYVLSLRGSDNVRLECLEITDRAGCVAFHSGGMACQREVAPFGDWAEDGLVAADSESVTLRNLDIHGLSQDGIHAGRLRDWLLEDVRIANNGMAGWDGDIPDADDDQGTMTLRRVTIEWNGCVETYPDRQPAGCWAQEAGGYGDGLGTGDTGGDWIIEDSVISHNTSDGLDLLYHRLGGTIRIERVIAQGNAGNQIKTQGNATIVNSVVVGNCAFFTGKPFTHLVDACRAGGNALSIFVDGGQQTTVVNNTVYSEGDCVMIGGGDCSGRAAITSSNNILVAGTDYLQPFENSCLFFTECAQIAFSEDHDLAWNIKDGFCPTGNDNVCADPMFVNAAPEAFDGHLGAGSPARDSGLPVGNGVPALDVAGAARPAGGGVDRGAYEMP
jgi:hypothetical protein